MKRVFWIALGATAGVLIAKQIRQSAQQLAPANVAGGLAEQAKAFWSDVRVEMAAREVELRTAFGLDEAPTPPIERLRRSATATDTPKSTT